MHKLYYSLYMVTIVNITTFRNNIGSYIDRLIYKKESVIITKGNKIVAKLVIASEPGGKKNTSVSPLLKLVGLWSDIDSTAFEERLRGLERQGKKDILAQLK